LLAAAAQQLLVPRRIQAQRGTQVGVDQATLDVEALLLHPRVDLRVVGFGRTLLTLIGLPSGCALWNCPSSGRTGSCGHGSLGGILRMRETMAKLVQESLRGSTIARRAT
jgi:hypothetical protein